MKKFIQIGKDLLSLDNVTLVRTFSMGEDYGIKIFHYGSDIPFTYYFSNEQDLTEFLEHIKSKMIDQQDA